LAGFLDLVDKRMEADGALMELSAPLISLSDPSNPQLRTKLPGVSA
jgi:hypothetical protein